VWGALDRWSTASPGEGKNVGRNEGKNEEPPSPKPSDVPTLTPPSLPQAVTGATPMAYLKLGRIVLVSAEPAVSKPPFEIPEDQTVRVYRGAFWKDLFFGRISGTMGVTSVLLILIGGLYLFYTKTASRTIIVTIILTYAVLGQILHMAGVKPVPSAVTALLGGGWLFGAFFMATDPISAPKTELGKVFYAVIIGLCSVIIRNFSIFNGGLMFSILIGNMFAPIIDYGVRARVAARNPKKAAGAT
jgi:Na+-translocating ferredoxin:NAD+ oxidoreductase RnfD subunit